MVTAVDLDNSSSSGDDEFATPHGSQHSPDDSDDRNVLATVCNAALMQVPEREVEEIGNLGAPSVVGGKREKPTSGEHDRLSEDVPMVEVVLASDGGDGGSLRSPLLPQNYEQTNSRGGNETFSFSSARQAIGCRDISATALFLVHFGGIVYLAIQYGYWSRNKPVATDSYLDDLKDPARLFLFCALTSVIAFVSTTMLMAAFQSCLLTMIQGSVILAVSASLMTAIFGALSQDASIALPACIAFVVTSVWATMAWRRIPFCAQLVRTAFQALRANFGGLVLVVLTLMIVIVSFAFVWVEATFGVLANTGDDASDQAKVADSLDMLSWKGALLLLSLFWTTNTICNLVRVTVVGIVGSWLLEDDEAEYRNCCCNIYTWQSVFRASTLSLGSSCLASVVTAFVGLANFFVGRRRFRAPCCTCLSDTLQHLLDLCNKWALVYVGLYGSSYLEAGKAALESFRNQGWMMLFQEEIVARFLLVIGLLVAGLTGFAGVGIFAMLLPHVASLDEPILRKSEDLSVLFLPLAALGGSFAIVLLRVVDSAVDTATVALAENPAAVRERHPELYRSLMDTFHEAYPGDFTEEDHLVGLVV